jgi:hypothetical protein
MERKLIVVGDFLAPGGRVLPYGGPSYTINGHQVALIGGRVYCEGCNSVGTIAKAGGPRRMQFISEVALEGDVVLCHCPVPPPLLATLQHTSTYEDMGGPGGLGAQMLMAGGLSTDTSNIAASKKLVDSAVQHPPEAEQTENICPNMTNKEFETLMLKLRDRAVQLIAKRMPELQRWNKADQARVIQWFGDASPATHDHLQQGLAACERVLRDLEGKNFVRYSVAAMKNVGCVIDNKAGVVAAVCKPDTASHTIAINLGFCDLRPTSANLDSKLSTLIHEATHFDDTFGSFDAVYFLSESLKAVKSSPHVVKTNADNIAGYVVWGEPYEE